MFAIRRSYQKLVVSALFHRRYRPMESLPCLSQQRDRNGDHYHCDYCDPITAAQSTFPGLALATLRGSPCGSSLATLAILLRRSSQRLSSVSAPSSRAASLNLGLLAAALA